MQIVPLAEPTPELAEVQCSEGDKTVTEVVETVIESVVGPVVEQETEKIPDVESKSVCYTNLASSFLVKVLIIECFHVPGTRSSFSTATASPRTEQSRIGHWSDDRIGCWSGYGRSPECGG